MSENAIASCALVFSLTVVVSIGESILLHLLLDAANNAYGRTDGGQACSISASGYNQ